MDSFLTHAGYAAVILFGFLEACCVPIPSEITFGFGGVLAYQGHLSLALVIILGTLAELAGSYVSYTAGRVGERPVVERWGRYVLITRADIERAERFLARRGTWAIPLARALPFVRSFTSVVAGFARVRPLRFGLLSLAGTLVYATIVASIGYGVGSAWNRIASGISLAGWVVTAVVVVAIAAFAGTRIRTLRREAAAARAAGSDTPTSGAAEPRPRS
jgi:membrane protein DedA with SNARE-associated domain